MKNLVCTAVLTIAGMLNAIPQASANVIYDVVVDYNGGYRFTFSMEFASPPPPAKTAADLIGGDFTNERFFSGVPDTPVEWPLFDDKAPIVFIFDGLVLSFASSDEFLLPGTEVIAIFQSNESGRTTLEPFIADIVTITQRTAVPLPGTLALVALGLPILWWRTRSSQRASRRSQAM